ncbi:polysaccharide biosynthesis/export family protein [Simiduia sp. 21SJ11W-1]|uniref:XrtA/PEP-CTERM system exopolysaccharide export protein n=1 Tax=Simiduia sp. 21SJ11W-1 TaxID=2909669 RepID=UPI00209F3158|nr:XrtA/PEP-CTERM system exopolysaccharide export protein [Simiduia sp. 21SJ11W-1]UTA47378.1 polysaccharide biosynthesis/export family protein [Simiduia sp. 21SJ11W-1]
MASIIYRLAIIAGLIVLAACAGNPKSEAPPAADVGNVQEYRIGVGDALQINVWRNQELSLAVPVRPDGKISMPLVGDIVAAGLTPIALSENIVAGLKNYVRNPQVTVIVANPSSSDFQRRVRITGAVQAPQSIPFREGMTVLDLVLIAGGANDFASSNNAKLYRRVNGEMKIYPVRLDDLLHKGDVSTNYPLQPSDIVTVPERMF